MFFMGLTLTPADFKRVLETPLTIAVGVGLQFLVMPLAAFLIASLLGLEPQIAAGLILVGCCAGGTASNVICYLAKANVALSISMTMVSTIFGTLATPFLFHLYVSETIEVNEWGMLLSIVKMVIVPVFIGVTLRQFFSPVVNRFESFLPAMAIVAIVLIVAIIVALNQQRLGEGGPLVLLAVVLHNGVGLI